jgi:flavin-binding protein dodecin
MKSIEVFTGFSESGIDDALQNALDNAGNPIHFEVIETIGSRDNNTYRQYQVTLKALTK